MKIEEMQSRRIELGYSYQQLAELAEMPVSTVQKILGGFTAKPRRGSLLKLQKALFPELFLSAIPSPDKTDHRNLSYGLSPDAASLYILRDSGASYGYYRVDDLSGAVRDERGEHGLLPGHYTRQGQYTLTDYYALPDEQRVELIDGVLYDMATPTYAHQFIAGDVYAQMLAFHNQRKGPCIPMIAPFDVQLDRDDKTMMQPDVLIVCDRSKIIRRCVFGAPDLVVEVLSPSTRKKDMSLKLSKYISAGVREYWIIEPDTRKVVVHNFDLGTINIYSFTDQIPVGIWNHECLISLSATNELLDEFLQRGEILPWGNPDHEPINDKESSDHE